MRTGTKGLCGVITAPLLLMLSACGGGGSGGGNDAANPDPAVFSAERVFPALSFAQVTDLQSRPYPPAAMPTGDRLFVAQKNGVIRVFDNQPDAASATVFLDITGRVTDTGGEQGLLGLAFHPQFETNGQFYVAYTVDTGSVPQRLRVSRFTVPDQINAPNQADAGSELIVLVVDQATEGPAATNHNGGALAFSPLDGLLYVSVGDGGGANDPNGNGQNLGTLSGSILRIDVDNPAGGMNYSAPANNPFVGQAGARDEIFAYGLRNPFKFTFDTNGDIWIGDVGQTALEEVDFIDASGAGFNAGPNFGWDCREGSQPGGNPDAACNGVPLSAFVDPLDEYGLPNGQSITGGFVYRGSALPSLTGRYLFADFVAGIIWAYDPGSDSRELLIDSEFGISTFGRDAANEVYFADFSGGGLYTLDNGG